MKNNTLVAPSTNLSKVTTDEFNRTTKIMRNSEGESREKAANLFLNWCNHASNYALSSFDITLKDKEDIISDFVARYLKNNYHSKSNPFSYLVRNIRNQALNYIKPFQYWANKPQDFEPPERGSNGLENAIAAKNDYHDIFNKIKEVAPTYAITFHLRFVEGYSVKEIAKLRKISIGSVKSNTSRFREKFQKHYKEAI